MARNYAFPPRPALLLLAALALAALIVAWFLQYGLGFAPCRLCLWQRWPYVGAIMLVAVSWQIKPLLRFAPLLLLALGALFALNAGIAFWHAGIEWGWFPPLTNCASAGFDLRQFSPDSLPPSVRCDEAPFRIVGLSLSFYNGLYALALALLAGFWGWQAVKDEVKSI